MYGLITIFLIKCAHDQLYFVLLWAYYSFIVYSRDLFTHIPQNCLAGTAPIKCEPCAYFLGCITIYLAHSQLNFFYNILILHRKIILRDYNFCDAYIVYKYIHALLPAYFWRQHFQFIVIQV